MQTTAGSTMPTAVILRCVPSQWQAQLIADLDRLQAQDAADAAKASAMRDKRTQDLHQLIDAAVCRYRLQLTAWSGSATSRAKWLRRQMLVMNADPPVPSARYIADYLKTVRF